METFVPHTLQLHISPRRCLVLSQVQSEKLGWPGGNSNREFTGQLTRELQKGKVSCFMGGTFLKPGAKHDGGS